MGTFGFMQVVVSAVWFIQRGLVPFAAELDNVLGAQEEELSKSNDAQTGNLGEDARGDIV